MPIYEYRCTDCSFEFEKMQKFSDEPILECPNCDGFVQKLISQSTFHLKGTGWYVTDYAKKSSSKEDANSPANNNKPDAKSSKSESSGSNSESGGGKSESSNNKSKSSDSSSTTSSTKSSSS